MTAPPREPQDVSGLLRAYADYIQTIVVDSALQSDTLRSALIDLIAKLRVDAENAAPAPTVAQPAEPIPTMTQVIAGHYDKPAEPRHLTRDEQAMLGRALRKSARRISPDVEAAMPDNRAELYEPPATDADALISGLSMACSLIDADVCQAQRAAAVHLIERQAREIADRDAKLWETRIRAESAEAERDAYNEKFQSECSKHDETTRQRRKAEAERDALREELAAYRKLMEGR